MNRRSLFSFLAAAPLGVAMAAPAVAMAPPEAPTLVEGPDWHLLSFMPEEVSSQLFAEYFRYAIVTDDPYFTRAASRAGWYRVLPHVPRTFTNTGVPCAMFKKWKTSS